VPAGFETFVSQRCNPQFPIRLLQFSNANVLYVSNPRGVRDTAESARTLPNLTLGTEVFRARLNRIFAGGFDDQNAFPGITY
jgi:hypothetical protein